MSISYSPGKIKKYAGFALILILVLILAYAIGTITIGRGQKSHVSVIYPPKTTVTPARPVQNPEMSASSLSAAVGQVVKKEEQVVASKKGTKYHLLSCPGAKTILEENKVFFPNEDAAKKAGYGPAKNCKGLNTE